MKIPALIKAVMISWILIIELDIKIGRCHMPDIIEQLEV